MRRADAVRAATERPEPTEPLAALDALRAAAMLLGVVLHASISYTTCRMPRLLWAVHDDAHPAFDWLFWWIHSFRLPLFFLIAGFFSARLLEKRGADAYLVNRARRILIPLTAACLVVLPLTYLVWSCGWLLSGQCTLGQVLRIKFAAQIQRDVYGLAHLWFLEHLFLISLGYWLWRGRLVAKGHRWIESSGWQAANRWLDQGLASRWRPIVVALPAAAILLVDPDVVAGFHNSFVPEPLRLMYYSLFFVAGVLVHRQHRRLSELTAGSGVYLMLSVPLLVSMGLLLRQYLEGSLTTAWRLALAADMALVAGLSVFGWLGLFLRWFNRPIRAAGMLADAAYWVYLAHLPLVGLVQVALYRTSLPTAVKFFAAFVLPLAATLMTYRHLVHGTSWGRTLSRGASPAAAMRARPTALYLPLTTVALMAIAAGGWQMRAFCFDNNRHVVLAGRVYRSAQPSPKDLRDSMRRWSLRSVVNLQGGDPAIPQFAHQRLLCQALGVQFLGVDLPEDGLPSRQQLLDLIAALERAEAPVLVHGRFGISRSGLAASVARLIHGDDVRQAKGEFSWRHGNLTATPYDCQPILDVYQSWLNEKHVRHTPRRFRAWARDHYGPEKILLGQVLVRRNRDLATSGR